MPFTLAAVNKPKSLNNVVFEFLAHLWGAYAIPMALSVVRRIRVSSVSTITTRNN